MKDKFIDVSSSPEPGPARTRSRTKPNVPVIELTDSDDDEHKDAPPFVRARPKFASNAVAGPSSHRKNQSLGASSSIENIPKKSTSSRSIQLFLSSDEENNPPAVKRAQLSRTPVPAPFPLQLSVEGPESQRVETPVPAHVSIVDLVAEPEPEPEPHSTVTARVLEIIPDVEPDYLLAMVAKHFIDHPENNTATVTELILHALFENDKYPKVNRLGKGKRKHTEHDEDALQGSSSKKPKVDYANKDRPFKGGKCYPELALDYLQTAFPFVPKIYLRRIFGSHNGLYAPTHLWLVEQEKERQRQIDAGERAILPYTKRATPYRFKGKRAVSQDQELEAERSWLLGHLESRDDSSSKEAEEEDDGACEDGIECGCCFSTYRFDKMVQCPETHLFCMTCMRSYASTLLGTHDTNIKCMDQSGCKAPIPPSELKRFLSEKLMELYERVKQRQEVEAAGLANWEECPFCEWGCVIENEQEKLFRCGNVEACGALSCRNCKKLDHLPRSCKEVEEDKHLAGRHAVEEAMTFIKESGVIKGYDHFNPQPRTASGSQDPNAGKCFLWDSVEQRHVDEVKAAAELAKAQYKEENPDADDDAIKVDLPVAPPNPAVAQQAQAVRNAQAAVDRAQAELLARQNEEIHKNELASQSSTELQYLEELKRVSGMHGEYEKQIAVARANMLRENTAWYQARGLVQQAVNRLDYARMQLQQAQAAQAQAQGAMYGQGYGHAAGYNYGFGMGGLNVNVNVFGGHMGAPPMVPVAAPRPAMVAPRPRARRRRSPVSPHYLYDHRAIIPENAPVSPYQATANNFRQDSSGWYTQVPTHSRSLNVLDNSAPFPPPGLAPATRPDLPPPPPPSNIIIHDFWKGRFAPFPGFSSRPGYHSSREHKKIPIVRPPTHIKKTKTALQLLPPTSFMTLPITPESPPSSEQSTETLDTFQFDKYADVFIPQYLKEIQNQAHNLLPLPPVPVFPPLKYLHSFLLPNLIEEISVSRSVTILSSPPVVDCPPLQIKTYHSHWLTLLAWELDHSSLEKEKIVLWKVGIKIGIWGDAEFVLTVAGVRENYPRLEVGDIVHLREVYEKLQRGSGIAFEGRVTVLRKREGLVHIFIPSLKDHILRVLPPNPKTIDGIYTPDDILPFLFNISFISNARPSFVMEAASATMGSALSASRSNNLARRWLFPDPADLASYTSVHSVNRVFREQDWVDQGLNPEQRLAASSIALHQSPVPYLISGPPGTGKTRTVVETVLQILRLQPEATILLCAPSNPATDTLVLRLRPFLQPQEMLRLNDPNRTFAEVPIKITQYCYIEDDKFSLPPWKTLMTFRVVAAQGSEPELSIPIAVVYTPEMPQNRASDESSTVISPQIVLCGDPHQLGPIVTADKARNGELDVSLLERLFERSLYADHVSARSKGIIKQVAETFKFTPFTNLVKHKNYRSHPAILMPPSALFYNDSLEPCANNGTITWSGLRKAELPLMFIGHEFPEECVDERATWYNKGEIDKIVETIVSLLLEAERCDPPLSPADIGIMAPWREQVWRLRERLRNEKLHAVDVGTVEDYQGRESRVVIISCVRSTARFLEEDQAKGLGLVFEKKRMNVAITRAKELLVVVGNGSILKRDPYWKGFIEFSMRHKLYDGPDLNLELNGNYVSRLESNYVDMIAVESEEEHGVFLAGGLARELLSDN
ncbi:hypothetical protein H0H93_015618 [Arthromyces matolae]|nr:hypothetical protein H0H93_015618 [Arthromyces matolae]